MSQVGTPICICAKTLVAELLEEAQASPESAESSSKPNETARVQDVLSLDHLQVEKRYCNDLKRLNDYVQAYFSNVHPLVPVLHRGAFMQLYCIYAPRAIEDRVREICDASSREGRAVCLICSVLALGAMSLVETRADPIKQEAEGELENANLPHYGEAMGFYGTCLRLMVYTQDAVEPMIAYLLMVHPRYSETYDF